MLLRSAKALTSIEPGNQLNTEPNIELALNDALNRAQPSGDLP